MKGAIEVNVVSPSGHCQEEPKRHPGATKLRLQMRRRERPTAERTAKSKRGYHTKRPEGRIDRARRDNEKNWRTVHRECEPCIQKTAKCQCGNAKRQHKRRQSDHDRTEEQQSRQARPEDESQELGNNSFARR